MAIMTPKAYKQILFEVFFKYYSSKEKYAHLNLKQRITIVLWANFYNCILALIAIGIAYLFSLTGWYEFDFILALIGVAIGVVIGVAGGVAGGVAVSVAFGVAFGVAGGVAVSVAYDVAYGVAIGVAYGVAYGVALGVAFGVAFGVAGGVAVSVAFGVAEGVAFGVAYGVAYFFALGRYFHVFRIVAPPPLKRNPLVWDENFGLPFPFLPRILKNYVSRRGTEYATELAVFLINERPVQRKSAQKGLLLITADRLLHYDELSQIAALKQKLDYLPESKLLPDYFSANIKELIVFSEDMAIAEQERNFANKVRIYKRGLKKLTQFQQQELWKKEFASAQFNKVVEAWKNILEKEISTIEESGRMPLPNPFMIGKPVKTKEGRVFIGRKDIVEEIQNEALREAGTGGILFLGNRRTGKSSTLLNMQPDLHSSLFSVFINLQSAHYHSKESTFAKRLTKEVATVTGIAPKEDISDFAQLTDFFEQTDAALQKQNRKLLVCFDEYERLTKPIITGKLEMLPDTLRSWIQYLDSFIFLFAGSHAVEEVPEIDWTDYLINLRTVRISYLDEKSALQLLTKPIPDFGLSYQPATLANDFAKRLGGQPYLSQAAMFELVEILNADNSRKTATPADIDLAIEKMFVSTQGYFEHFWQQENNEDMRHLLTQLIQTGKITTENKAALHKLLQKEIIVKKGESYQFAVPVIRQWIEKNVL